MAIKGATYLPFIQVVAVRTSPFPHLSREFTPRLNLDPNDLRRPQNIIVPQMCRRRTA